MTDETQERLKFVENELPRLLSSQPFLAGQTVVKCSAEAKLHLDGFMSSILTAQLLIKDDDENETLHKIIVKIMKGDESFRRKSKALIQSSNEVFVYKSILPHFIKVAADAGIPADNWCAKIYFADCAIFPELGKTEETVLALEDLTTIGYRMSSARIDLDAKHLMLMARKIASFHAISFAMKIQEDPMLEKLVVGLIPFHIKSEMQGDLEPYKYLCPIAFERVFNYAAKNSKYQSDENFNRNLKNLQNKMPDFLEILENFLRVDHDFAAILHGDYYRNNVMFKYDEEESPTDLRTFDFQEVRHASVVIDLSIFMFMHVHESLKPLLWDELLKVYHETLTTSIIDIVKCERSDNRLAPFTFESFIEHFKQFAFYGVAVSVLSIPWMASPEEETQKISEYFERDMHDPEFKNLLQVCGGKDVSERIVSNVKHASDKGYMKIFA